MTLDNKIKIALATEICSLDDIKMKLEVTKIVKNKLQNFEKKYFDYDIVKLSQNIKYVYLFLKENDNEYARKFIKLLNDDIFTFEKFDDNENKLITNEPMVSKQMNDTPYSFMDIYTSKHEIYIPLYDAIIDSYSILHESFHEFNKYNGTTQFSMSRTTFSEGVSIASELLFEDYLKKKNVNDYICGTYENLNSLRYSANEAYIKLFILKLYLEKRDIKNYFTDAQLDYFKELGFNFSIDYRYILGTLQASLIDNFKLLTTMNECINNCKIEKAMNNLNLKTKIKGKTVYFDDASLSKMDEAFTKMLKRRGYSE